MILISTDSSHCALSSHCICCAQNLPLPPATSCYLPLPPATSCYLPMPRPSKRKLCNKKAGSMSAEAKKRRHLAASTEDETQTMPQHSGASDSDSDLESDSDKEVELSDPDDDILEIKQPTLGWAHAERQLPGYSKTNTGKTRQSKWYQKQKKKEQAKEKEQLQATYGDISRWFNPSGSTPFPLQAAPTLLDALSPSWLLPPPSSSPIPSTGNANLDFEQTFLRTDKLTTEIHDLEDWLKKKKKKVTGDWLKRVQGIIGLLRFHGSNSSGYNRAEPAKRRQDWIKYSVSVALSLGKGQKYAQALRRWERDWVEIRTPPPCPQRGRHVKRVSLFNDEGVSTRTSLIAYPLSLS
ncbi:hypothetical protein FN846DRAFT_887436 [Sphaerosporella brunnea]|uniref:Uncharacterized protein n=1 Tax=Sphaerosporella brunnea TaxID=1250544 RepID=A0A5J5F5R0_9PEZI|nr:hypothetical protein FN846DRAFT_887436 [Sphaerosporella brunnea]